MPLTPIIFRVVTSITIVIKKPILVLHSFNVTKRIKDILCPTASALILHTLFKEMCTTSICILFFVNKVLYKYDTSLFDLQIYARVVNSSKSTPKAFVVEHIEDK